MSELGSSYITLIVIVSVIVGCVLCTGVCYCGMRAVANAENSEAHQSKTDLFTAPPVLAPPKSSFWMGGNSRASRAERKSAAHTDELEEENLASRLFGWVGGLFGQDSSPDFKPRGSTASR
jgi:hypothetical protein